MSHEKDTFQGIMLERAVTRGHADSSNLPLFLLCSDNPVNGPALMLLKKADHPYPYPQTFKNTSEFPVPLCISQEECGEPSVV